MPYQRVKQRLISWHSMASGMESSHRNSVIYLTIYLFIVTSLWIWLTVSQYRRAKDIQAKYSSTRTKLSALESKCPTLKHDSLSETGVKQAPKIRRDVSLGLASMVTDLLKAQERIFETYCANHSKLCVPGPNGDVGDKGMVGLQGEKGESGEKGLIGLPGDKGTDSPNGFIGNPGPAGDKGDLGLSGTSGQKGEKGYQGSIGLKGDHGAIGVPGDRGSDGIKGEKGDMGSAGIQTEGSKGGKGALGPSGAAGPIGERGIVGPPGIQLPSDCLCIPPGSTRAQVKRATQSCFVCNGDPDSCWSSYSLHTCNYPNNYCINEIYNKDNGTKTIVRRCGTYDECVNDWWYTYSDDERCTNFLSTKVYNFSFACKYCCTIDKCNFLPVPPRYSLFVDA